MDLYTIFQNKTTVTSFTDVDQNVQAVLAVLNRITVAEKITNSHHAFKLARNIFQQESNPLSAQKVVLLSGGYGGCSNPNNCKAVVDMKVATDGNCCY